MTLGDVDRTGESTLLPCPMFKVDEEGSGSHPIPVQ
jgi:hypothetical protein